MASITRSATMRSDFVNPTDVPEVIHGDLNLRPVTIEEALAELGDDDLLDLKEKFNVSRLNQYIVTKDVSEEEFSKLAEDILEEQQNDTRELQEARLKEALEDINNLDSLVLDLQLRSPSWRIVDKEIVIHFPNKEDNDVDDGIDTVDDGEAPIGNLQLEDENAAPKTESSFQFNRSLKADHGVAGAKSFFGDDWHDNNNSQSSKESSDLRVKSSTPIVRRSLENPISGKSRGRGRGRVKKEIVEVIGRGGQGPSLFSDVMEREEKVDPTEQVESGLAEDPYAFPIKIPSNETKPKIRFRLYKSPEKDANDCFDELVLNKGKGDEQKNDLKPETKSGRGRKKAASTYGGPSSAAKRGKAASKRGKSKGIGSSSNDSDEFKERDYSWKAVEATNGPLCPLGRSTRPKRAATGARKLYVESDEDFIEESKSSSPWKAQEEKVSCPLCNDEFISSEIEKHASECQVNSH